MVATTSPLNDFSAPARNPPDLLISGGDPAGIAPECFLSLLDLFAQKTHRIHYFCNAGAAHLDRVAEICHQIAFPVTHYVEPEKNSLEPEINAQAALHLHKIDGPELQKAGPQSGLLSFQALQQALEFAKKHEIAGLLTLPLSKRFVMEGTGLSFDGHTSCLRDFFSCAEVLMLMHGVNFSVVPLTEHIPLKEVPERLLKRLQSPELPGLLLEILKLPSYAGAAIALCGLNPHAGENGLIGKEEQLFAEIMENWQASGLRVDGPVSADAVFLPQIRAKYRLILSCYHDQGLIPFKALEGRGGVNVTIGLPFLRTSPDHGPAYDLAGKGIASTESTRNAFAFLQQGAGSAMWN
jgi:4-hydroxythreonine-4-phosphate dehydrogenase